MAAGDGEASRAVREAGLDSHAVVDYKSFDFRGCLLELLGLPADLELSRLHEREDIPPCGKLIDRWNASTRDKSFPGSKFGQALTRFVREVVFVGMAPRGGWPAGAGAATDQLVYQARPSLRVQPPGQHGIRLHTDREYHHQPAELNWWVPLTPTAGTNTLWLESEPGRGDYAPVELLPGQALRFYGNACRHYTQANGTAATRVSFDLRVCRGDMFDADSPVSAPPGGGQRFAIGGYYTQLDADGGSGGCGAGGVGPMAAEAPGGAGGREGDDNNEADQRKRRRRQGVEKPSKAWRAFREAYLRRVMDALELPTPADSRAAAELEVALGDAARAGEAPSFTDPQARYGYTRSHFLARSAHIANLLMLRSPVVAPLRAPLVGEQSASVVSVGGGPGFDAVGIALVAAFAAKDAKAASTRRARVLVLDNEPGWEPCVDAVATALSRVRDSSSEWDIVGSARTDVSFGTADILRPLTDPANHCLAAAAPSADLFVFAHVVVENAKGLLAGNLALLRELFTVATSGAGFIFTDNTHRLWPAIADAASACGRFSVALPAVHGKHGFSLCLRKTGAGMIGLDFSAEPTGEALLQRFRRDFESWAAGAGAER
eukprot:jgi/Tetstr1/465916/TSEL_010530.t1